MKSSVFAKSPKEGFELIEALKACTKKKDLDGATRLYVDIVESRLLWRSPYLASDVICMFASLGLLGKAQELHDIVPVRVAIAWNALIRGYSQQGHGYEALNSFATMQTEGVSPDAVTYIYILKACGNTGAIEEGEKIHRQIMERGLLETNIGIGNSLVDMYTEFGMFGKAWKILNELPAQNSVSWNTIIAGYVRHGRDNDALNCYGWMQDRGHVPNSVTFVCILKACGNLGDIENGKKIHDEIIKKKLLHNNVVVGNALVCMYAKCGMLAKAHEVLDDLPTRNIVTWSSLIAGYSQHGQGYEALNCFERMQSEGHCADEVTFVCILKACGNSGAIGKGKQIHDEIVSRGLLTRNVILVNALVDMYVKCGALMKAQELHDELHFRNIVTWNSLIAGYAQQGHCHEALNYFKQMRNEGISPDAFTYVSALKACGSIGAINIGKQIHEEIVHWGLLSSNVILGTALVDMYAKCGMITKAQQVLGNLPVQNEVSWSAVIAGYVQQEQWHKALTCFDHMLNEGVSPNAITFVCILKACGHVGAINKGKDIHNAIMSRGLLGKEIALGTALVDMYAKCGMLTKAQEVIEMLPGRNVVTWSALIGGYAQQGHVYEAVNCFKQMQGEGFAPNSVTFLCLLNACSQSGLLNKAHICLDRMRKAYDIAPNLEHHTCMVLISGCSGYFDDAVSLIEAIPSSNHPVIWLALLGACRKWGNLKLAKLAFDQMLQLDSSCPAAYSIMSSVFYDADMKADAKKVEAMRIKRCAV